MKRKFNQKVAALNRKRRRHIRRIKIWSRHPFAVPIITFLGLIVVTLLAYNLFIANSKQFQVTPDSKIVIISHDGTQQIVPTDEPTVGVLLSKLHITLNQGDVVEPSQSTPINQDDFRINIYRAVPVEIVDGSTDTYTFSASTTPRAIVEQAGVKVYPQDYVSTVPVENFLSTNAIGEQVVIDRATPVDLNLYGTPLVIRTHAQTVEQLIQQEKIKIVAADQVIPAPSTPITANTQVFIVRKGTKIQSVTQTIAMPVQTIEDSSLAYGTSATIQQGSNGTEVITYQDQLQNGIVVSQTQIQDVVTVPAVTEIVDEGTSLSGIKGDMALAGIPSSDYQYADYIISHESGWCTEKLQGDIGYCPVSPPAVIPDDLGYGLCQATPGSKMDSAGADWETDPVTQLEWCNGYANSKYGGWYSAYEHWMAYGNWYSGPIAKKSLGQHWLKDELVLDYILDTAEIKSDETILEIGPGTGNLTKLLLTEAKQVIAVELDQELVRHLNNLKLPKLEVVYQDILTYNFEELEPGYKIVANIPYYLTGKLIRLISEIANRPSIVILLVQKEIAERMAAKPGDLSILGLISQYFFEVEKGMLVPADKFVPAPKVDSQVIILRPRPKLPLAKDRQTELFKLIRIGFAARRKTILNNLSSGFNISKEEARTMLNDVNIDPIRRPQSLSLEQWITISKAL